METIAELKSHLHIAIKHGPCLVSFLDGIKADRAKVSTIILALAEMRILNLGIVDYDEVAEIASDYIDDFFENNYFHD